jgi:sugar lactone lactonase YvrE
MLQRVDAVSHTELWCIAVLGGWTTSRRELLAGAAGGVAARALLPASAGAAAIPTDRRPDVIHRGRAVALAGGGAQLVVAHHERRTLTVTERRSGRAKTLTLSGQPLELAVSPHSVLVAVTTAFWDNPGLELLHVRGATHRARLHAGDAPFAPAFTRDRRQLLVTGGEQQGALRILAAPDFARVRVVELGRVPRGLAITRDDAAAWVALHAEDAVVRVALASGRVTRRIATPPLPDRLALSPDGRRLLVSHAGRTAGTLTEIDTHTGRVRALPAGDHVSAVAWGARGQRLAALGKQGAILAIDARGRRRRLTTVTAPRGLAVAGRHAFTVSAITGQVGRVRT